MNNFKNSARIIEVRDLIPAEKLLKQFPITNQASNTIFESRSAILNILKGKDNSLLVIIGPCSIHDIDAAKEYASKLRLLRKKFSSVLEIIMRVYFEKPRTTIGWKGLINDPYMDKSFNINDGLRLARNLLLDINNDGLPTASEFLDIITPFYFVDLISWGAIGARTTESQIHRELASSLPCPIGFKNGTDGTIQVAIDAIQTASTPHCFLSVTTFGNAAIIKTIGNNDCHIILRGGNRPNYSSHDVKKSKDGLIRSGLKPQVMIDCSHANSNKQFKEQINVAKNICQQISHGETGIIGVMIESNLVEGSQNSENKNLLYGQSITDSCIGFEDTETVLERLAESVLVRRKLFE